MNILSLNDNIGAARLALKRAGIPITNYFAYEPDESARDVALRHFPTTYYVDDLFSFPIPMLDIIIASGTDLNLLVELLDVYQPEYFIYVRPRMSVKKKNEVTQLLFVEPILLNSDAYSAQDRSRLYWTNLPLDFYDLRSPASIMDILTDYPIWADDIYPEVQFQPSDSATDERIMGYFSPPGVNQQHSYVYSPFYKSPPVIAANRSSCRIKVLDRGRVRFLNLVEMERLMTLPDNYAMMDIKGKELSSTLRTKLIGKSLHVDTVVNLLRGMNQE